MAGQCPYCESTRSLLIGNVFCSRHHNDMGSMESGTLFINSEKLEETADHVSRLSIRMILNGTQWYNVGGVDRALHKDNFLVIDQGQNYRTAFQSENGTPLEMAVVAFKPGAAGQVWRTLSSTPEELLDDPNRPVDRIGFFEHTHDMDHRVRSAIHRLHTLVKSEHPADHKAGAAMLQDDLLEHLIALQKNVITRSERIPAMRSTTRLEIWRRLNRARDQMEACFGQPLTLVDLANTACLSEHHFKRLFRQAFGVPPHRYLIQVRMKRAGQLLSMHPVSAVAALTGYADVSAFIRAFRKHHGHTPGSMLRMAE
jgi:AraC family transcriptional regulator